MVFVVHGRDVTTRERVGRFLEHLKPQPIILHEQANRGSTLIEKLLVFRHRVFDRGVTEALGRDLCFRGAG